MRHPSAILTIIAMAVALLTGPPAGATGVADKAGVADKTVTYRGYQVEVPADWPVIDLEADPTACVRFDRPAVYLGPPAKSSCPAKVIGRADALLIQPLTGEPVAADAAQAPTREVLGRDVDHEITFTVAEAGVAVTASYGDSSEAVQGILRNAGVVSSGFATTAPPSQGPTILAAAVVPGTFRGEGFDACAAPASEVMQAWLASPYRAIGVYIGGVSRGCSQPNLTAPWVSTQISRGWHLAPIYVGHQAPCNGIGTPITNPAAQGISDADDAVAKAEALGMSAGSVIYNDMEGYDNGNAGCRQAVLTFLSNWTARLHDHGYLSGVYSSAGSGIVDLVANYNNSGFNRPNHVWFARWDNTPGTTDSAIPAGYWANHQRIKQYRGGHNETHGGATINIDNNTFDVSNAGAQPPRPESWGLHNYNAAGGVEHLFNWDTPDTCDPITGDWNGNGTDTVGAACRDNLALNWAMLNGHNPNAGGYLFSWGSSRCVSMTGDWDGNGSDTPGTICLGPNGAWQWSMHNYNAAGSVEYRFDWGPTSGCWPVVGDWNGDRKDTPGVVCPRSDGQWHWALHNYNQAGGTEYAFNWGSTQCGPIIGDWDGNRSDTPGTVCARPNGAWQWGMHNYNAAGAVEHLFEWGSTTQRPIVGDWDGNGTVTPGTTTLGA
ncbi:glycoside hydrolase domain-containing protein [Nonomuraea sp. LPB2021202275-12-8]|uniref:glycoside hydrolase domain-containing protein n=1 Tax=Nonomuraea sp. LPB2021202275-12-8 TaxID=3120159 RepID=UPI00300D27B0